MKGQWASAGRVEMTGLGRATVPGCCRMVTGRTSGDATPPGGGESRSLQGPLGVVSFSPKGEVTSPPSPPPSGGPGAAPLEAAARALRAGRE